MVGGDDREGIAQRADPPLLGRKPRAVTYSIEDLMELVLSGKIRVPEFQRPIRWRGKDARALLDSIYRGYPIGTLLLWKREGAAGTVRLGPLAIAASATSEALWVLDGQQRLTALAAALLASHADAGEFAMVFDLETMEFLHAKSPGLSKRTVLPLPEVLDSQRLLRWLFERGAEFPVSFRERAMELGKAVREYHVPAYEVESDTEEVARHIFNRLNSTGKKMHEHEVFDALHGSTGRFPGSLQDIAESVASSGFGRPAEKDLLRAVKAIRGIDVTKPLPDDQDDADLVRADRAIRAVVAFLRRVAHIPRYELLAYKLPLPLLSRFFDLHPEPTQRSQELLARWVWRGTVSGVHSSDAIGARRVLEAMDEDEEASVQRLLAQIERGGRIAPGTRFNFRHAGSKLETLALVDLGPLDLESSAAVDIGRLFDEADDTPVRTIRSPDSELSRTVANRVLLPNRNRNVWRALRTVKNQRVLESHGIDLPAAEALRNDDWASFLQHRSETLERHTKQLLERRTRWNETDRPSIASLQIADDA